MHCTSSSERVLGKMSRCFRDSEAAKLVHSVWTKSLLEGHVNSAKTNVDQINYSFQYRKKCFSAKQCINLSSTVIKWTRVKQKNFEIFQRKKVELFAFWEFTIVTGDKKFTLYQCFLIEIYWKTSIINPYRNLKKVMLLSKTKKLNKFEVFKTVCQSAICTISLLTSTLVNEWWFNDDWLYIISFSLSTKLTTSI